MTFKLEPGRLIVLTTFDGSKVRCANLTRTYGNEGDTLEPADLDDLAHEIVAALNLREKLRSLKPAMTPLEKENAVNTLNLLIAEANANARTLA